MGAAQVDNHPPAPAPVDASGWRFAGIVARCLVGGLFVITAVAKIADPLKFAQEIQDYQMAPVALTNAMAIILPWLEGLAGVLLVFALWRAEARWMIGAMLVVFTIAKAYAYFALGKSGACGCGGDSVILQTLLNNPQGMITNLVLIGLLVLDAAAERATRQSRSPRAFAVLSADSADVSADPAN